MLKGIPLPCEWRTKLCFFRSRCELRAWANIVKWWCLFFQILEVSIKFSSFLARLELLLRSGGLKFSLWRAPFAPFNCNSCSQQELMLLVIFSSWNTQSFLGSEGFNRVLHFIVFPWSSWAFWLWTKQAVSFEEGTEVEMWIMQILFSWKETRPWVVTVIQW